MGNFLESLIKTPTLKITMFGPRGVGKTTVLTSIFKDSTDGIAGSQIFMRSGNTNSSLLLDYSTALEYAIEEGNAAKLPASNTENDFLFELGVIGKKPTVNLQIQDFPGEYLKETATDYQKEQVRKFVDESNVILLAVDTVFLMEEKGRYNDSKNNPTLVKDYIRRNSDNFEDKLVLFVPLKSERYFHEGRMGEVAERVKQVYGDLRDYFIKNNIASAIVPIMSLGGMELDNLHDDPTGVAEKIATFRIYQPSPKYNPLFCSQPIYYLLTYVAAHYDLMKRKGTFLDTFRNLITTYLTKDTTFLCEIRSMRSNIIADTLGFEMVTSNSIFSL